MSSLASVDAEFVPCSPEACPDARPDTPVVATQDALTAVTPLLLNGESACLFGGRHTGAPHSSLA